MTEMPLASRIEFVLLFDVKDGNPNGDPDAGNMPRADPETGHGIMTDVSQKRKIRNFVGLAKGDEPPYEIYVKEKAVLNRQHERAYAAINFVDKSATKPDAKNKSCQPKRKGSEDDAAAARAWMCKNFYDVRTFGAVMSTGVNCGQVRGPVQITFARSIDPIFSSEHAITRMAVTTEAEAERQNGDNRTMGRKHTIPYAVYRSHGFISAHLAEQSGFTESDLTLFWDAVMQMFEHDRSTARGEMSVRGLYVFRHDSKMGNAPAHLLLDRVTVEKRGEVISPRQFNDYVVTVNDENLPKGVQLTRLIG